MNRAKKTLVLNKSTVTNLNRDGMKKIYGGKPDSCAFLTDCCIDGTFHCASLNCRSGQIFTCDDFR